MDDGGSAFPQQSGIGSDGTYKFDTDGGMSLRDYFAAKAMQGELAAQDQAYCIYPPSAFGELAENSYKIADAMLAQRAKAVRS